MLSLECVLQLLLVHLRLSEFGVQLADDLVFFRGFRLLETRLPVDHRYFTAQPLVFPLEFGFLLLELVYLSLESAELLLVLERPLPTLLRHLKRLLDVLSYHFCLNIMVLSRFLSD